MTAASAEYDPQARWWPVLRGLLLVYRLLCIGSVNVDGRQNLGAGARVMVSNHARVSDGFLILLLAQRPQALVQGETFTLAVLGKLVARSGWIPVVPGQGRQALNRATAALRRGQPVLVYPEGRLSLGGEMLRGKTGAARLAFESGAPIQPIAVHVAEKYSRIIHGKFYGRPTVGSWQIGGPARVVIGEPWRPFEGATKVAPKDLRQVTDEVMARVRRLLDQARAAAG